MVMWWTCPQYLKKHEEGKKKRAEMRGGSHIQGSIPISLHLQKEVSKLMVPSFFEFTLYIVNSARVCHFT
jgi:hypothetical protein